MKYFHPCLIIPFIASALFTSGCLSPSSGTNHPNQILSRITFGSCVTQEKPTPIWDTIVEQKPDLFIFTGDSIYAKTHDIEIKREEYKKLWNHPGFTSLRKACPFIGTWDDNDYGVTDSGAEYKEKKESKKAFLEFCREPENSPRWKHPGVYHAEIYGPPGKRVQIILLDTRYFRSKLKLLPRDKRGLNGMGRYDENLKKRATVLGKAQWLWLEEQLKKPADLRVIVSSTQVMSKEHHWERWQNFPAERERLFKLIYTTSANGVVFVSGDRHHGEISMHQEDWFDYPVFEITSSSLNKSHHAPAGPNKFRTGPQVSEDNFGMIEIDWKAKTPKARFSILNVAGKEVVGRSVYLKDLKDSYNINSTLKK